MKENGMNKKINIYIVAAAVVIITGIAVILALTLGRKEETYRSIKIIELEGGVTIDRDGVGILEAASNMNLISGDSIQTGQGAYAVLQLDSDKYVMLAESGRMSVVAEGDEANSRTAIRLETGSVLNEIQNPLSSGSSYDVVTPNATMSVRGTVFEVRKNSDNIEVLVYDGTVAVGLDGKESVLYEAGEYTLFTAEESPRFIIERTEITEDVLNDQVLKRLEQIDSQSRELNLGEAQLASAQTQNGSVQTTPVPEAATKPVPTVQPTPSAAPSPSSAPTATPAPAKTPQPQVSSAGTVQATPEAVSPEPEEEESDEESDDDDWDWNSGDNHNSGNKPQGGINYANFWQTYTMAKYQEAVDKNIPAGTECTVVFYLPYIAKAEEKEGDSIVSTLQNKSPDYFAVKAIVGEQLTTEPEGVEKYGYVDNSGEKLTFAGWCIENGTPWDQNVKADTCLYPVWKDSEGTSYYPVIVRSNSNEVWGYYCNNVKMGSRLAEIILSGSVQPEGWNNVNDNNNPWKFNENTVGEGTVSLEAVWNSTSE